MSQYPRTLYQHQPHPHTPRNPNAVHQAEQAQGSAVQRFNTWLSVHATIVTSSVWCFYFFLIISATGFPGIPGVTCTPQAFIAWFSSQFLQLILLPLIAAGTAYIGRKQEIQADEIYHFAEKAAHDGDQMMRHLDAQDAKILAIEQQNARQIALIEQLLTERTASSTSSFFSRLIPKSHKNLTLKGDSHVHQKDGA